MKSIILSLAAASMFIGASSRADDLKCEALFLPTPSRAMAELYDLKPKAVKTSQIQYKISGPENAPVIVLIHGLGGSLESWNEVAADLEKNFRVLRYDLRGHGKTPAAGEDYFTDVHAKDLLGLLDSLHIEKAHIVGHSLGARVGIRFVDLNPDRVLSYTSEDMGLSQAHDGAPEKFKKSLKLARAAAALKKSYESAREFVEALLPVYDGDIDRTIRFAKRFGRQNRHTGRITLDRPEVPLFFGFQANIEDFGAVIEKARVPLLFLRANPEESPFFPDHDVQLIHQQAPTASIVSFPHAGHNIHADDPDGYILRLRKFISSVPKARP